MYEGQIDQLFSRFIWFGGKSRGKVVLGQIVYEHAIATGNGNSKCLMSLEAIYSTTIHCPIDPSWVEEEDHDIDHHLPQSGVALTLALLDRHLYRIIPNSFWRP